MGDRGKVEALFRENLLVAVACTSTLALGVRYVWVTVPTG